MSEAKALKKKSIPKVLKDHTWTKWIGDDIAKTKCMCCELNEIKMNSFHCGHVIAEADGGSTSVENLRPICSACNLSMKTENMEDFKKRCGYGKMESLTATIPASAIKSDASTEVKVQDEMVWEEGIEKRVLPKILTIPKEKVPGYSFTFEVKGAREKMTEQLKDLYIPFEYASQNIHFIRRNKKYEASPKTDERLEWEKGILERVRPKILAFPRGRLTGFDTVYITSSDLYKTMYNEVQGYYQLRSNYDFVRID